MESHEYLSCIECEHPLEAKVYGDEGFDDAHIVYYCGNQPCRRFGLVTEIFKLIVYTEKEREELKQQHVTAGDISDKN